MKKALLFFLLLVTYLFVSIPLAKLFENIQYNLFRSPTDVLFMHTKITNAIIAVGLIICFAVLGVIYSNRLNPKKYFIVLALFMITLIVAFVDIFSYSAINEKGVVLRKSIAKKAKYYDWSDVNSANIDYSYGKDKYGKKYVIFKYYLTLKDGNKIFFRNSEDFRSYNKVITITEFLKSKGITINKADINSEDLHLIISNYKDEYGKNTEKMFRNLYNVVN